MRTMGKRGRNHVARLLSVILLFTLVFPTVPAAAEEVGLPDGLVAYWPLTANTNDTVGAKTAALSGGAEITGEGLRLADEAQKMVITQPMGNDWPNSAAISVWVNPDEMKDMTIFSNQSQYGDHELNLYITAAGAVQVQIWNYYIYADGTEVPSKNSGNINGGAWLSLTTADGLVSANQWSNIIVTLENGLLTLYVDGTEENWAQFPETTTIKMNYQDFGKDEKNSASNRGFAGLLKGLQYYNRALTEEEVQVVYNYVPSGEIPVVSEPVDNRIAYWDFNEGSGTAALDQDNGIAAEAKGAFAWSAGKGGTALTFSDMPYGSPWDSGNAVVTHDELLRNIGSLTIGAWVKITEADAMAAAASDKKSMYIIGSGVGGSDSPDYDTGGNVGLYIKWNEDVGKSTIGFSARGQEPDWYGHVSSNEIGAYDFDAWNHIAVSYDKDTKTVTFYFNGENAGSHTYASGFTASLLTSVIGGYYSWGEVEHSRLKGSIDELKIFNKALSAEELAASMAVSGGGEPLPPADPFENEVLFPFDEGEGETASSLTGGLTATLASYTWSPDGMGGTSAIAHSSRGQNGFSIDYGEDYGDMEELTMGVWIKPSIPSISSADDAQSSLIWSPYGGTRGDWVQYAGDMHWSIIWSSEFTQEEPKITFDMHDWDKAEGIAVGLDDGEWHYVAFSLNMKTKTVTLYFDGEQIAAMTSTKTVPVNLVFNKWFGGNGYQGRGYTGLLDNFSVIPSVLDDDAHMALYNRGLDEGGTEELPGGLIARWPLNEFKQDSGTRATDVVSGEADTIRNAALLPAADSMFYGAAEFTGAGNSNLSVERQLAYNGGISVSMWVNANDLTAQQQLFATTTGGAFWEYNAHLSFGINPDGSLHAWIGNGSWHKLPNTYNHLSVDSDSTFGEGEMGSGTGWYTSLNKPITEDAWYHITLTYDNTSGRMLLYVDGEKVGGATVSGGLDGVRTFNPSTLFFGIGKDNIGFNGAIDDIHVYNRALNAAEVAAVYNYIPGADQEEETPVGDKVYHVAKNGSDSNPGTEAEPFLTIQKAADIALAGETVIIHEGVYTESVRPANNGTVDHPLTFKAAPGGKVVISGADLIGGTWTAVEGGNTSGVQYNASGSNNLWKLEGITLPMGNYGNQILVDRNDEFNEILSARYPNVTPGKHPYFEPDFLTYEAVIDASWTSGEPPADYYGSYGGHSSPTGLTKGRLVTSLYEGLEAWNASSNRNFGQPADTWAGAAVIGMDNREWQLSGAEVTGSGSGKLGVKYTKDRDGNIISTTDMYGDWLTLTSLNFYELGPSGYNSGQFDFYIQNAFAALDAENEWWYDETAKVLWLQLPEGEDPNSMDVYHKARITGLDLSGRQNIHVEGIDLLCSNLTISGENNVIDGMKAEYVSTFLGPSKKSGAVSISGKNHTLMNSEIAYASGPLIDLRGAGHKILNNKIHDANTGGNLYDHPLHINGRDHLIKYNEIYNASGTLIGGAFHGVEFAYNNVHDGNWHCSDLGLFYMAFGEYGNSIIHHNWFHDSHKSFTNGVYFDLGCKNALVYSNVFWNLPWASVFIHAGAEFISVVNNTTFNSAQYGRTNPEIYTNSSQDAYMSIFMNNITDNRGVGTANTAVGAIVQNNYAREEGPVGSTPNNGWDESTYVNASFNPANPEQDFQLKETSGARGVGIGIEGLHDNPGEPVDAGAYQYGEAPWTAGVRETPVLLSEAGEPVIPGSVLRNLMINSAFEWPRYGAGTPSDGETVPYWTITGGAAVTVQQDSGSRVTARGAWQYSVVMTGPEGSGIEQTITGLIPGTKYIMRGHARVGEPGAGDDSQRAEIGVRFGDGTVVSEETNKTGWGAVLVSFTADESGEITVFGKKLTAGKVIFDDFSVTEAGFVDPDAPPPEVTDEYPMFVSPVALLDDWLYEGSSWETRNAQSFIKDEAAGITLTAEAGKTAAAFYTGAKFEDSKDFYVMLDKDEYFDAEGAYKGNLDAAFILRAGSVYDPDTDENITYRYELSIKGSKAVLTRYNNTRETVLDEWDINLTNPLLKLNVEYDNEAGLYGTVTVSLKIGSVTQLSYADDSDQCVRLSGYFGIATDSTLKLGRLTELVGIEELLTSEENWTGDFEWLENGVKVSPGSNAGFIGRKYGNAEFVMSVKAPAEPGDFHGFMLRVQETGQITTAPWTEFRYNINIKNVLLEVQSWPGGDLNIADNKSFIPKNTATLVKVSTVNTDYGVWIRIKVGDTIVANGLDTNNTITQEGYFAIQGYSNGLTISIPDENTYIPHIGDPDLDGEEEHEHEYDWAVTTPAGCTTPGVETGTCECGDTQTRPIPAAGHSWGSWAVTVQPTAAAEGTERRTCSVCGAAETRSIAKLPETKPPVTEYIPAEVTELDDSGKGTSTVKTEVITEYLDKLESGQDSTISIKTELPAGADNSTVKELEIVIPVEAADRIAEQANASLTVDTPMANISFDAKAFNTMLNADEGAVTVSVTVEDTEKLGISEKEREKIGDRPVYNFTVKKGETEVSRFEGGKATIVIPYELKPGENPNAVVIYYIDNDGKLKTMRGKYDEALKAVVLITTHFSYYAVGYNPVTFLDVLPGDNYLNAVDFISARGITLGDGTQRFNGRGTLTRADFVVMLLRAYGYEADDTLTDNFADAGSEYYTPFLAVGKDLGIIEGQGHNMFNPNAAITRQEMFVILYRLLSRIGELPEAKAEVEPLDDYLDKDSVSSWAYEELAALVEAGIVKGDGQTIAPLSDAQRYHMAQVLYNILAQ